MEKAKNSVDIEHAPEILLWETSFEFVSPLPLNECASRIHDVNAHKPFFSPRRKVFLSSIEARKVEFHLSEPSSRNVEIWVVGYLEQVADDRTAVTYKVGISPEFFLYLLFLSIGVLIFVPIALRSFIGCMVWLIFLGILLSLFYISIRSQRANLISKIQAMFNYNDTD